MTLHLNSAGKWEEPGPPSHCERCAAAMVAGAYLVGTSFGRRTFECLACQWVHGTPDGKHAVAPMGVADGGVTKGGT